MILIRGADQGEIQFIGNGKDNPSIAALKEIAFVVLKEFAGDNMTAAHQTYAFG